MLKLVVTGVSSFIGMHLAKHFSANDFDVVGTISRDLVEYSGIQVLRLESLVECGVKIESLDILDESALRVFVQQERPNYWLQHAGWAEKYSEYGYDFDKGFHVNVSPLKALYSSLVETGCQGVVLTGSSAEYSNGDLAACEIDACFPLLPYGLSKLCETLYASQLAEFYSMPTRVVRVFIPYGAFDNPLKLISSVILSLNEGRAIDLSACTQKRDFLYVDDLVAGYGALVKDLQRDELFDIFNICSGRAVSLKDVLLTLARHIKRDDCEKLLRFGARPMRAGEDMISYGSNQKAIDVLGWSSRYDLMSGIDECVDQVLLNNKGN